MNILVLEDERAAANRLLNLIKEVQSGANIMAVIETVSEATKWLAINPSPDIIVSDIQLADGISFDAFKNIPANIPILFTTAYDLYMLKAFKLNSIDYLLKPIDKDELAAAFNKYHSLHNTGYINEKMIAFLQQFPAKETNYKSRFLVKRGEQLTYIPTNEVAWLRADDKLVFLHTVDGRRHFIDDTLDEVDKVLDPAAFFRINRSYIVNIKSIRKINTHFNGRLKIEIQQSDDNEIFVSRQRVAEFKKWLDK